MIGKKTIITEKAIQDLLNRIKSIKPDIGTVNSVLTKLNSAAIASKQSIYRLLKRPQVDLELFNQVPEVDRALGQLGELRAEVVRQVEIEIKYEGYFQRQKEQLERFARLEERRIPDSVDYESMSALSKEAREKLSRIRPLSLGQAARISGVSPSDIAILSLLLIKQKSQGSVPRGTD